MGAFFDIKDFYNSEGEVDISETGYENIMSLCNIVLNSHYSYVNYSDREDLISIGVLKTLELLKRTKFDPSRSSLKNYLYTGVRNEMKNYLYRTGKEVIVDDEILYGMNKDEGEDCSNSIDPMLVITKDSYGPYLALFSRRDGDLKHKVLSSLRSIGFSLDVTEGDSRYYPEVDKVVILVIWDHMGRVL